jgi:hypothetical protein
MTKTEWKKRILTVPLSRDGRPVKELQGDLDMQSESEHQREAEIARAASERTSAEVKALEEQAAALARKVARLEAAETPLPEYSAPVNTEAGTVGDDRHPPDRVRDDTSTTIRVDPKRGIIERGD